jgi:hypothetical protein
MQWLELEQPLLTVRQKLYMENGKTTSAQVPGDQEAASPAPDTDLGREKMVSVNVTIFVLSESRPVKSKPACTGCG